MMLKLLFPASLMAMILSSVIAQERQSHIDSIEIMVSDCSHCGMSPLGQIHVKVRSSKTNTQQNILKINGSKKYEQPS